MAINIKRNDMAYTNEFGDQQISVVTPKMNEFGDKAVSPDKSSILSNMLSTPASIAAKAISGAGQTMDIIKNAATSIGKAESAPLDTSNPIAAIGDIGGRIAAGAGNMIRVATSPAEAALRTNVFQPSGAVSKSLLPLIVNKLFQGQGIPQQQLDQIAANPQTQKALQDTASNAVTQSALLALTPRQTNLVDQINANPGGWEPPNFGQPASPAQKSPLSVDMLNTAAPAAYKAVDNSNTGFSPDFSTKVASIINQAKLKPIAGKVLPSEDAEINNALGEYDALSDTPLSLNDYQRIDSTLGNKAAKAYISRDSNQARIIGAVQDKIRGLVSNINPADVTGDPEGINTLTQHAIPMWSVKRKIEDLQAIVENANMTKNPQTAMQTGFKNLIKSGRIDSYPPEVQSLIKEIAVTGTGEDLLSIVGSRLNPIAAGAVAGPHGAIVAQGTSYAARAFGNAMKNRRADAIIKAMLEQVRPSIEKFANPPAPTAPFRPAGLLPAPEITNYTNNYGQTVRLSPAGRESIGQSAASPVEPTLKEIMGMKPEDARAALEGFLRRQNTKR